jgi:eukaryotic-like serine/threonine-protein kinase
VNAASWAALKDAFAELVDLSPAERKARLTDIGARDPERARRIELLLAADASAGMHLEAFDTLCGPFPLTDSRPPLDEAAAADPLGLAGRQVAQFRVRHMLGSGGMGVAYEATDLRLGRTVALKFLLPQFSPDVEAKQRFLHEARAASALDHPNVCTILEVGESEHGLFLAMPAYPGETLKARIARDGALPASDAVAIVRQVLSGVGAAHAAGITHRDIKPGNIIVMPDGTVKILDFGLAKVRDAQLTEPGLRPGTVAYMSPEQVNGAGIDQRADLWAVGVVLHEMLTGQRPFGSGSDLSTLYAILNDEPDPPSTARTGIPEMLDDIVARLLRKHPAERYQDAADVLADLDTGFAARTAVAGAPKTGIGGPRPLRVGRPVLAGLVVLFAAATTLPILRGMNESTGSNAAEDRPSIAVLPFTDTSPERDQEYLGDGIAEEILNALAGLPGLRVPARSSSFSFKGGNLSAGEIARQLGVANVLEGSVHRTGDRVRVTARLLDTAANRHLWSQTFNRDYREIFALQAEIADTVAHALEVRFSGNRRNAPTEELAAYELYLRGVFHWNRRTLQDLRLAIEFFEQATHHDPAYAQPYAGLALSYALLHLSDPAAVDALGHVESYAARALDLDPALAEAHAARGYAHHWQWRWRDAEREFERALVLNPGYSTAHQWYGEHLTKMGRRDEGEALMRRAITLDPLSLVAHNDLGIVLMLRGRFDEAIAQFEQVRRMDPGFALPLLLLHRANLLAGHTDAAADAGRRWAELSEIADPTDMTLLARATTDPAQRRAAQDVLTRWAQQPTPRWPEIAMYYALLDERERALDALEQAMRVRAPMLAQLKVAPWLDPLRSDPRFAAILAQLAFP